MRAISRLLMQAGGEPWFGLWRSRRSPALAATVAVSVGLGVGANLSLMGLLLASVFPPAPFSEAGGLVVVENSGAYPGDDDAEEARSARVSGPDFEDWQREQKSFVAIGGFDSRRTAVLRGSERPVPVSRTFVTRDLLQLLRFSPILGRLFVAEDFRAGAAPVAAISEGLWRSQFGEQRGAVGGTIDLDGQAFEVVGVLPDDVLRALRQRRSLFDDERANRAVITPLLSGLGGENERSLAYRQRERGVPWLTVVGRLSPGVSLDVAAGELRQIAARLAETHPKTNENRTVRAVSLGAWRTGPLAPTILVIVCASLLTLALACANAASAMLVDCLRRWRELSVRAVLGASRRQLVAVQMVRGAMWALPGGALALLLGGLVFGLGLASPGGEVPTGTALLVLCLGVVATAVSGGAAGAASVYALRERNLASELNRGQPLMSGARTTGGLGQSLVGVQVGIAAALTVGAGLLLHSLWGILAVAPGFEEKGVVTIEVLLPRASHPRPDDRKRFHEAALARLAAHPDIVAAGVAAATPLSESSAGIGGDLSLLSEGESIALPGLQAQFVSPGYRDVLGLVTKGGQWFSEAQYSSDEPVIVVDEAFCRRHLPGRNPLEASLRWGRTTFTIIGVIGDVRHEGLQRDAPPTVYVLHSRVKRARWSHVLVRGRGAAPGLGELLVREVQAADSEACLGDPMRLSALLADSLRGHRRMLAIIAVVGAVAVSLAGLAVFGALWQFVASERRGIAVRLALGAQRSHIGRLLAQQLLWVFAVAAPIGLAGGAGLGHLLSAQLHGVSPAGVGVLGSTLGLVLALVAISGAGPTWNATRTHPARALHSE